jgi:hypothetical protein
MRTLKLLALLIPVVLAACGGGGGGGDNSTSTPPPSSISAKSLWDSLTTTQNSWSSTGSANGSSYTVSFTATPQGQTSTASAVFNVVDFTVSSSANGSTQSINTTRVYVNQTDLKVGYVVWPQDAECLDISNASVVPDSATANTSGNLANGYVRTYSGNACQISMSINSHAFNWAYKLENNAPYFCIDSKRMWLAETTYDVSFCFGVNQAGNALTTKFFYTDGTLKATN